MPNLKNESLNEKLPYQCISYTVLQQMSHTKHRPLNNMEQVVIVQQCGLVTMATATMISSAVYHRICLHHCLIHFHALPCKFQNLFLKYWNECFGGTQNRNNMKMSRLQKLIKYKTSKILTLDIVLLYHSYVLTVY